MSVASPVCSLQSSAFPLLSLASRSSSQPPPCSLARCLVLFPTSVMAVPACFSGGADLRPPDTHLQEQRFFLGGGGVAPTSRYCCRLLLLATKSGWRKISEAGIFARMEELGSILFLGDKESMRWQLRMGEFRRAGGGKKCWRLCWMMCCCFAAHCCSWSRCCLTRTRTHSLTHSLCPFAQSRSSLCEMSLVAASVFSFSCEARFR